jgi:hypothetical protein
MPKESGMTEHVAQVWQDGIMVAEVCSPDVDTMRREISHYAMMYRQDGPVEIRELPAPHMNQKGQITR